MDRNCIFCRILAGSEEGSFVYRDDTVSAFLTIGPVNPGHVLVVPTRHAAGIADLTAEENAAIFSLAQRLSAALRRGPLSCQGVNYWLADGEAAFQDVFHAHLHVIPRFTGDSLAVSFERGNPTRQELDRIASAIAAQAGLARPHP